MLPASLTDAVVHSVESKSHSLQRQSQSHSNAAMLERTINNPALALTMAAAAAALLAPAANGSSFDYVFVCHSSLRLSSLFWCRTTTNRLSQQHSPLVMDGFFNSFSTFFCFLFFFLRSPVQAFFLFSQSNSENRRIKENFFS